METKTANRQIARAAGTIMIAMVVSQVTGLVAKMLISRAYDTAALDAFFAANRLPELLFNLVAGGALGSAFIPVFATFLAKGERSAAWRLASAITNLVTLVATLLSLAAAIFAPQVITSLIAPGFTDPAQQAMTASFLRIQLISTVIFGISGIVMGILNAHQKFLFPALAPSMYQMGWIIGVLVFKPYLGISGLSWGIVLGAFLHLVVQIPSLLRLPGRAYRLSLGLDQPAVREVAVLMAPRLLGVAVVQLNFWLNTYLASHQPEGSLTGISLAFPLMLMPQAAIAQSIAIATLPTFSRQAAQGKLEEMRSSLATVLRSVLLLSVPASLGLMILCVPLVKLLYPSKPPELIAWALLWYALGLVGHSTVEVICRAFYALHDTRTPVVMLVIAMGLNLGFSLLFSWLFGLLGWAPHGGLALANSVATGLEMVGLLFLMRRHLKGLEGRRVLAGGLQAALAALVMSLALWGWLAISANLPLFLVVVGAVISGGAVYGVCLMLLRNLELNQVWQLLRTFLSARK